LPAAVARWIADHPGAVVGNVDLRHRDDTLLARISARWYDTIEKRWRAPDDWPRVIVGGFAIRADVFSAVGGFEPEYRLFAPPLMSARLHARGTRIEVIPGASVLHVDVDDMRAHHAATALFARGEFAARARVEPTFMERYFGHAQLWANQLRERPGTALSMMRAVLAAGRAHPGKSRRSPPRCVRWRRRSPASACASRFIASPCVSMNWRSSTSLCRRPCSGSVSIAPTPGSST
jgi:hypothetical protein